MTNKWQAGSKKTYWFVSGDGQLWLSTARISKRNAIAAWLEQATDEDNPTTWKYWYRRRYRAVRAQIRFKVCAR